MMIRQKPQSGVTSLDKEGEGGIYERKNISRAKIAGIALSVLTVLLLIALMFAALGVGGFFGKTISKAENISYAKLAQTALYVPLISSAAPGSRLTSYPEKACRNTEFEKGKVPCVAYEYQTADFYAAVAKQGRGVDFDVFSFISANKEHAEKAGSCAQGDICRITLPGGGAAVYYAEKDGVTFVLIPFDAGNQEAAAQFSAIFTFAE